jgi:ABC-type dipeptide/oligopeptide/nickel transport system permease component
MAMRRYVARRLLALIPTLLLIYTIVFFLMRATPGGPWDETGNRPVFPEVRENLMKKYHLNDPLWKQYVDYLKGALRGDLGPSYRQRGRTVNEIIADFFPISLQLGLAAMMVAVAVGVPLGFVAAVRQNTWVDRLLMFLAVVGISTPSFVVATVLIVVFGVYLRWVPTSGWSGLLSRQALIPLSALALWPLAAVARYSRSSMLEVIRADYVRTARAKGLGEFAVVAWHAAKNALIPVVTITGVYTAFVVTGSFYVESVTGVPGLGRYMVLSISARDYPIIMGTTLLLAVIVMVLNLLVDVTYALLDPRIRYE